MDFIRVPPDSTGKRVGTITHTISAVDIEVPVHHLADATTPANTLAIDVSGSAAVTFAEGQPIMSGFGNLKTTAQRVLGVYDASAGSYDDLFSITENTGGTSVYDDTAHTHVLSTTTSNGSEVIRTTNRYHYYLPGSSNFVMFSAAFGDSGKANNVRRIGLFDDNDGVFFELNGTTFSVVIRSSTSGSMVDTPIAKASWNVDKLDGTGKSGLTLDITKFNLYWIDYQWLGAGRVRFGIFGPDGTRIVTHQVENAGANYIPYMRSGTLPFRTQNKNSGATGSVSQLIEGCVAIYVEGTHEDYTFWRVSGIENSSTVCGATKTHIISMSSKANIYNHHNSIVAYPETLCVHTDQPVAIYLYQNTSLTSPTWNIESGGSIVGATNGTLSLAGLYPFKVWFLAAGTHMVDLQKYFELNDEAIQLNADETISVWSLVGKKLGATDATVVLNVNLRELW